MSALCVECDAELNLSERARIGQRIVCPSCGVQLEVISAWPLEVDVSGLTALSSAGLTDVLESFDTMWTETSTTDAPSLDDLDPQELERVQGSWEI